MTIKNGDKVKVEYTGTFEDGTVFDASEKHGKPLVFEVGAKHVVPGFDKAIVGMEKGEEKEFTLTPEEAYGQPNDQMVQKVPKDKVPAETKEGMVLGVGLPTGQQIPARVTKVDDKEVTLDMNHPLAGKTLKFKIKVIGINDPEDKKEESCCGGHDDNKECSDKDCSNC
jgi:FKBP-type peptidyl-prolyl cis-trans isomerase 2